MKQIVVAIKGNIEWKGFRARSGAWIGVCDSLNLTMESDTWANLLEDIGLALNEMFIDLLKSQELEKFLRERNWRRVGPIPSRRADVWFDLPFSAKQVPRDTQVALR